MTSDHCPACAAPALPGATYCSHCATPLAPPPTQEDEVEEKEKASKAVWIVFVGSVVLLLVAGAGYRPGRGADVVQPVPTSPYVQVVYRLSGTAYSASVTYTNDSGNVEQRGPIVVPSEAQARSQGIRVTVKRGSFVYFSAQNQNETGSLECAIEADGITINRGRSEGAYTIVTCSVTVS